MIWTPVLAFVFLGGSAVILAFFGLYADRSERIRATARRMYTNQASTIWLRNGIAVIPFFTPGFLLFGSLALWPREVGHFLISPALLLVYLAFAASYRVPAPFLPGWLRREVDEGVTPVARPDRWDWVVFVMVSPFVVFTIVFMPVYFVAYPNG